MPDWAFVAPKTLAIALVLISTMRGRRRWSPMVIQAIKGYFHFELGKYLLWYVAAAVRST